MRVRHMGFPGPPILTLCSFILSHSSVCSTLHFPVDFLPFSSSSLVSLYIGTTEQSHLETAKPKTT